MVLKLLVTVGTRILAKSKIDNNFYSGIVILKTDNKVVVQYNTGGKESLDLDDEEWLIEEFNSGYNGNMTLKPRVIECRRNVNSTYSPVFDFDNSSIRKPKFKLPPGLELNVENIVDLFFPESLLEIIQKESNQYANSSTENFPDGTQNNISKSDILQFFSILFYMGVVKLPAKTDYWTSDKALPTHNLISKISGRRFNYIWRYIHFSFENSSHFGNNSQSETNNNGTWFKKVTPMIDHVRKISKLLMVRPGETVALDEMMVRFKGRSVTDTN